MRAELRRNGAGDGLGDLGLDTEIEILAVVGVGPDVHLVLHANQVGDEPYLRSVGLHLGKDNVVSSSADPIRLRSRKARG